MNDSVGGRNRRLQPPPYDQSLKKGRRSDSHDSDSYCKERRRPKAPQVYAGLELLSDEDNERELTSMGQRSQWFRSHSNRSVIARPTADYTLRASQCSLINRAKIEVGKDVGQQNQPPNNVAP
jgi:hypothetical protein